MADSVMTALWPASHAPWCRGQVGSELKFWILDRSLFVQFSDGVLQVPLDQFKRLSRTPAEQLLNVVLRNDGMALRWPELDEDINIGELLARSRRGEL